MINLSIYGKKDHFRFFLNIKYFKIFFASYTYVYVLFKSAADELLRGEKLKYNEEFVLRAENYGNPEVRFAIISSLTSHTIMFII